VLAGNDQRMIMTAMGDKDEIHDQNAAYRLKQLIYTDQKIKVGKTNSKM
jgi:hypothetical protein